MTKTKCNECHQRALQGPCYDPLRGTGRTTRTLNHALLAATTGHQVLHVSSTGDAAKAHCRTAQALLEEAAIPFKVDNLCIYIDGHWIEFKSMHSDLGYRGRQKPSRVYWDHSAEELREIARRKAAIFEADMQKVRAIMMKHDLYKVLANGITS